ncbi:uncharacterized protein METZ01_LOCUS235941 [marine metagenome]|uniref:Uncharacterized protein n=1 Tax=marine metagenome TaxID=408172 RepID=A0A382H839_9ZZZZ
MKRNLFHAQEILFSLVSYQPKDDQTGK